jgi:dynein heavy chain 1
MTALSASITEWLRVLPAQAPALRRSAELLRNPLFRCLEREVNVGASELKRVRSTLDAVAAALSGAEKPTAEVRTLMQALAKDQVPRVWRKLCHAPMSVPSWIADIARRLAQLQRVCARNVADMFSFDSEVRALSLGALFFPEAFFAGTRQATAQATGVSLERLELHVSVEENASAAAATTSGGTFLFTGISLSSASWANGALCAVASGMPTTLPSLRFQWRVVDSAAAAQRQALFSVPVYHDHTRAEYLFTMQLPSAVAADVLVQRGVAAAVWSAAV